MKKLLITLFVLIIIGFFATTVYPNYITYQVDNNDTPRSIAEETLKIPQYFRLLMKYNGITQPDQLRPGKILKIPYSISNQRIAQINFVDGQVLTGFDNLENANQGDYLIEGQKITTGSNGRVEITLDDGSVIRIGPNTRFELNGYNYINGNRNTNVQIGSGITTMRVTRMNEGSNFNISTVTAVAGVRGTYFYVNHNDETGETGIAVYSGCVVVSNDETEKSIESGYATVIKNEREIETPFPIPNKIRWME